MWLCLGSCDEVFSEEVFNGFQASCLAQCENAAGGEGCDTDAILNECGSACDQLRLSFDDACLDAYEALVRCERGRPFVCNGSISINGVDWPVLAESVPCDDADALYEECQQAPYSLR